MAAEDHRIDEIRRRDGVDQAILFLHGFGGNEQETWGQFPTLIRSDPSLSDWDILSLGYSTRFVPDIRGVWSADPDLRLLALNLETRFEFRPLEQYASVAMVAHSMGGLIVQRALLDQEDLVDRMRYVVLFGTPSGGLRKSGFIAYLKPQLRDMAKTGAFIVTLRREWAERFDDSPPFVLRVVGGTKDVFVDSTSSLDPFPPPFRRAVAGDHLSMVKPSGSNAESFLLLSSILGRRSEPPTASAPLLTRAMDMSRDQIERALADRGASLTEAEVVNAAIRLDLLGERQRSIELLDQYGDLGTDIKGTLGGRYKRLWLDGANLDHAKRAVELYGGALEIAEHAGKHEQVYYHAINLAFLFLLAYDHPDQAATLARLALRHCALAPEDVWRVATEAEAQLYLGRPAEGLERYRKLLATAPQPWQLRSAGEQAYHLARKLGDEGLQQELLTLFENEAVGSV